MKFAVAILLGGVLVFALPGMPALYGSTGLLAALLITFAEVKWPKAKPSYIDPVNRPKPITSAGIYVRALTVAAASGLVAVMAWNGVSSNAPTTASFGTFLAAFGAGIAIGSVLSARRVSEAHNQWVASMSPQPE